MENLKLSVSFEQCLIEQQVRYRLGVSSVVRMVNYASELAQYRNLLPAEEWSYAKKRQVQEILPRVYLGPFFSAGRDAEQMQNLGITHSIIFRSPEESRIITGKLDFIQYEVIECRDTDRENLIQHFPKVKQAVDIVLASSPNARILFQGTVGISIFM